MARTSSAALPDDNYLLLIGQLAYTVSYLEWTILGDLPKLGPHLPAGLTTTALAGKSTGKIAGHLTKAAPQISDDAVRTYVERAGQVLSKAADLRNDVLHARSATSPSEGQRLFRWKMADWQAPARTFFVDVAWLENAIDELSAMLIELASVRVGP